MELGWQSGVNTSLPEPSKRRKLAHRHQNDLFRSVFGSFFAFFFPIISYNA